MLVIEKMNIAVMMLSVNYVYGKNFFCINILHGGNMALSTTEKEEYITKKPLWYQGQWTDGEKISGRIFSQMEDSTMKASMIRLK